MGVYRIQIQPGKTETIPSLMQSMGFPVIRTEKQDDGDYYFCVNPKRSNKTWTFWITPEKENHPRFFMCGLSRLSRRIVNSLSFEGIFEKTYSEGNFT